MGDLRQQLQTAWFWESEDPNHCHWAEVIAQEDWGSGPCISMLLVAIVDYSHIPQLSVSAFISPSLSTCMYDCSLLSPIEICVMICSVRPDHLEQRPHFKNLHLIPLPAKSTLYMATFTDCRNWDSTPLGSFSIQRLLQSSLQPPNIFTYLALSSVYTGQLS